MGKLSPNNLCAMQDRRLGERYLGLTEVQQASIARAVCACEPMFVDNPRRCFP